MSNLMCCKVCDASMTPTLKKGGVVMIDKKKIPLNGEIGVFTLNGENLIKRYKEENEEIFLLSDDGNSKIKVNEIDQLKIVGRMVGTFTEL